MAANSTTTTTAAAVFDSAAAPPRFRTLHEVVMYTRAHPNWDSPFENSVPSLADSDTEVARKRTAPSDEPVLLPAEESNEPDEPNEVYFNLPDFDFGCYSNLDSETDEEVAVVAVVPPPKRRARSCTRVQRVPGFYALLHNNFVKPEEASQCNKLIKETGRPCADRLYTCNLRKRQWECQLLQQ